MNEKTISPIKEKLIHKDKRFAKLWDFCCDMQCTDVALRLFEEWEK